MSKIFYSRTCERCKTTLKYLHQYEFTPNICKCCKIIPDESLNSFIEKIYSKPCPICNRNMTYKTRAYFLYAIRNNKICKSCASSKTANKEQEKLREQWEPIIGYWNIKFKTFVMIRKHWGELSDEKKTELLKKTKLQRKYYWRHLHRMNKRNGYKKSRETISKNYGGEKHWMKRPEVLQKVIDSCKKYRGNGHWFRKKKIYE